ncbi:MAG: hypothetical protein ACTSVZ_04565, partial [Promethearchaeota archaeon]
MTENVQFCPKCGISLATATVCPKCHWDPTQSPPVSDSDSGDALKYGSGFWLKLEKLFGTFWPWLWRITGVFVIGIWIFSLLDIFPFKIWKLILFLLSSGSTFLFVWYYSRYSESMVQREYNFLVNDVVGIGSLRIPKILLVALGINLGLYLWGGLLILVPVVLFIIFSPVKVQWMVGKIVEYEPAQLSSPSAEAEKPEEEDLVESVEEELE